MDNPPASSRGGNRDHLSVPFGQRDPVSGRLVLSPKKTMPTADAFLREFYHHPEGRTLHHYAGQLLEWRENRFVHVEDAYLEHRIMPWLHKALRYVCNRKGEPVKLVDFESNPMTVRNVLDSIRSRVFLPVTTPSPSWLGASPFPVNEILPCKTLNLHISTEKVFPATPKFFTTNALDFDFNPNAEPPERWIKFLEQLYGDDIESVELLQEWFGYCLTGDTSRQRMMLLVGPKRSGKGTIARILRQLVGEGNVAGPTTGSLAGNFGLQPLIGKSLAIISDARFRGEYVGTVVERLLCISGEDLLTIERKFLGAVSMKLSTRFMFLTNELPRFTDASTALASRFLVLKLTKSFYGEEDLTLTDQLLAELPGILRWAVDGWKRLHKRGRFIQPQSSADAITDIEELSSPVAAFLRECCVIDSKHWIWIDDLYNSYKAWCEREGRDVVSNKQVFGRDFHAVVPGISSRRSTGGKRFYEGVGLKTTEVPL